MKAPPPLPEETLRRVHRVARFDGMSVVAVAGIFALLSAARHDVSGAVVGVIVAGAGAVELHGASLLTHGQPGGIRWLAGSQLYLLISILGYVAWRLGHPDPMMLDAMHAALNAEQRQLLHDSGVSEAEFVNLAIRLVYFGVALATVVYQGGMLIYYMRRRGAVEKALGSEL